MGKAGSGAQGVGRRTGKAGRQDLASATSVEDVKQQVADMLQHMEKTIEAEYHTKYASAIKAMEERISKTAQAHFDAVTSNITAANGAMEQVQSHHKEAVADLHATQRDLERSYESRNEYKASLDAIVTAAEDHIGQIRKKYKLSA